MPAVRPTRGQTRGESWPGIVRHVRLANARTNPGIVGMSGDVGTWTPTQNSDRVCGTTIEYVSSIYCTRWWRKTFHKARMIPLPKHLLHGYTLIWHLVPLRTTTEVTGQALLRFGALNGMTVIPTPIGTRRKGDSRLWLNRCPPTVRATR